MDDHAPVLALLVTQLREHHVTMPARRLGAGLRAVIRNPERGRILVATGHGDAADAARVVGFAAISFMWPLEHGGRGAWLEELYVVPALREHGVGTALLREAIRAAKRAAARAIDLEVDADHARAAGLYERHGFTTLPRRRFVLSLEKRGPVRRAQGTNSAAKPGVARRTPRARR